MLKVFRAGFTSPDSGPMETAHEPAPRDLAGNPHSHHESRFSRNRCLPGGCEIDWYADGLLIGQGTGTEPFGSRPSLVGDVATPMVSDL